MGKVAPNQKNRKNSFVEAERMKQAVKLGRKKVRMGKEYEGRRGGKSRRGEGGGSWRVRDR
jgi:hypothetical protein